MTTHAFRLWIPLLATLVCSACREQPSELNVAVGCSRGAWDTPQLWGDGTYREFRDTAYVPTFESAIDLLYHANAPNVRLWLCGGIETDLPAGTECDLDDAEACNDDDLYGVHGSIPVGESLEINGYWYHADIALDLLCEDECNVDIVSMDVDYLRITDRSGLVNLNMSRVSFSKATIEEVHHFRYGDIRGGALSLNSVLSVSPDDDLGYFGILVDDLSIQADDWGYDEPEFLFRETYACNLVADGIIGRLQFIDYSFGTSDHPCAYGTASVSSSASSLGSSLIVESRHVEGYRYEDPGPGLMQIEWGGDVNISADNWEAVALQVNGRGSSSDDRMRTASISGHFGAGLSLSDITTLELQAEIEPDNTDLQTPAIQLSNIETAILSHSSVDISGGVDQTGIGLSNVGNVIADDLSVDVRSGVGLVAQNVGNLDISNSSISGSSHALEETFGSSGAVSVLDSEIGGSIVLFSSDQELGQFGSDDIGEFWSCAWRDGDLNCI